MNSVPAFEITDPQTTARLIRDLAFAQVVTQGADGFAASSVPLLLDVPEIGPWRLRGHLARSNPQARIGGASVPALALFVGPHTYVSPTSYPTWTETGNAVPTWNYVEVHVHGTLSLTDTADRTRTAVSDLTDVHESGRAAPWRVADAPDGYVDGLLRGIVGFELVVDRVEAKAKLSQNKPEADRAGVVADLEGRAGDAGAGGIAELMRSDAYRRPGA